MEYTVKVCRQAGKVRHALENGEQVPGFRIRQDREGMEVGAGCQRDSQRPSGGRTDSEQGLSKTPCRWKDFGKVREIG